MQKAENRLHTSAAGVALVSTIATVLLFFLLGCSTSRKSSEEATTTGGTHLQAQTLQKNRDLALQHFIEGSLQDLKGDYAKAILEYQDALRYDQDPAIFYALSKDYRRLGKYYLAVENAREAVRLHPKNIIYHENLAQIFLSAHELDSALSEYKKILQIDSNYTEALYGLARLYQSRSKPLEAIGMYKKLLNRLGPDWEVLYQLSQLYENLQMHAEAAGTYEQMLSIDPGNIDLKKRVVELYIREGKLDSALIRLDELLDTDSSNPDIQVLVGDLYLEKDDPAKALEYYNPVAKDDSVGIEAKLHISETLLRHSQKDSTLVQHAKKILESIRTRWPEDWRVYWYLGFSGFATRNDSVALLNFSKVTQLNPLHAEAFFYLGTIFFRMEQHDSAAKALERSVEINPRNVDALGTLALTYDSMNRHEASDRIYEQALKMDVHNHVILNNYSYSLAERGIQLERALEMAKEAVDKQPENSAYLDTIGWIYFKLGIYETARKYIEKAVELRDATGENGATLNEHLGDVYYKLNQKDKALEYWKRAHEMNKKSGSLKKKIESGTLQ